MENIFLGNLETISSISEDDTILIISNSFIKGIKLKDFKEVLLNNKTNEDIENKIKITSFTTDKISPQEIGTSIILTTQINGENEKVQYKYYRYLNGTYAEIKDWSTSNSVIITPSIEGTYDLWVAVKDEVGNIERKNINFVFKNKKLTATKIVNDITVGWNLGGSFECTGTIVRDSAKNRTDNEGTDYETWWGNPLATKELIKAIKTKGFNAIRVPITWVHHFIFDNNGNLTISPSFLNRVKEVVGWILDEGMYCIINTHHDDANYGEGETMAKELNNPWDMTYPLQWLHADDKVSNPEVKEDYAEIERRFKQVWTVIANEFKNFNNNLIFEGYNELQGWRRDWSNPTVAQLNNANKLNQAFVNTVRASGGNNTTRVLCVQTYGGYETSRMGAFKLPKDTIEDGLIVQVHLYTNLSGEQAKNLFSYINTTFISKNIPVILGEFGLSVSGGVEEEIEGARIVKNVIAIAKSYNIKAFWWDTDDFTNKGSTWFGLINRKTLEWVRPLLANAIIEGLTANPNEDGYITKIDLKSWKDYTFKSICNSLDGINYISNEIKELGRYYQTKEGHFSPIKLFTCKSGDSIKLVANSLNNAWRIDKYAYYDKDFKLINTVGASSTPISLSIIVPSNSNIKYIGFSAFNPWRSCNENSLKNEVETGNLYLTFESTNNDVKEIAPKFPQQINCTELFIEPNNLSFNSNEIKNISVKLIPNNTTNSLRFKSSNPFVATVDNNGRVVSVGNGNTDIIIECGNINKICNVIVSGINTKTIEIKSIDGLDFGKLDEKNGEIIPNSSILPGWVTTKAINVTKGTKFFLESYMNNNLSTPAPIRIQSWVFYDDNNNFISSGKFLKVDGTLNTTPDTGIKGVSIPSNATKFRVCLFNPWGGEVFQPIWYQNKFNIGWSIKINSDGYLNIN